MTYTWYGPHHSRSDLPLSSLSKGHRVEALNEDSEGVYRPKGSRNARMALDRFRTLRAVSRVFGSSV